MKKKYWIEKRNALIKRSEEIVNKAVEEQRDLTEDEVNELESNKKKCEEYKRNIELIDSIRSFEETAEERSDDEETDETRAMQEAAEERAFVDYVRGVVTNERSGELSPASGSAGKLIPKHIAQRIIKKVYDICPIVAKAQRYNVKGTIDLPYYDESTTKITVAYATEFTDLTSSNAEFTVITLSGYLAGALSKISKSLINNTEVDIVSFIVDDMAQAIARFMEKECLDPSNAAQKVSGLSTLTNSLTAASATDVTADEIIKLKDKVKDVFQQNAMWIMSTNTRTAVRLLKDGKGRYLFQDDVTAPFGGTILGKPVYVSDNMPDMAASKRAIFYGDPKALAVKVSEDINIEVLRELYAAQHAVGVVGYVEFDAKVQNQQAMSVLVMHA